jgi:hypothetical protein
MMRPLIAVALGLGIVLGTSACASTPTPHELQREAMQPAGTPSPPASPIPDPRHTREITGEGFRVAADSAFQQLDRTSRNGEPMLVLRRASRVPALPIQVAVLREPDPGQDVVEQSYALEMSKRTLGGATDISRSDVAWPNASRAVLVQWTENVPTTGGESVPTRYWQLNAQVTDKLILIVVGFAPAAEFADSKVDDVVRTFRINT